MASCCPSMPDSSWPELVLIRHGIAEPREQGRDHPDRGLTAGGCSRTQAVMQVLVRRGLRLDRLVTSPYRRALETAELAVQAGLAPRFDCDHRLRPTGAAATLVPALPVRVGLVGHEPDLGDLACALLGLMPGRLRLKKAGVILLRRARDGWQLEALLKPGLLLERPD